MANTRAIHGPPVNAAAGSEHLPWAILPGTTLEPSIGEEDVGHQPYGAGAPPDYRHENYHRKALFDWLLFAEQGAVHLPRNVWSVTIGGAVDAGDQRRITIDGHNFDHTVSAEITNTEIAETYAAQINLDPLSNALCYAYTEGGAVVYLVAKGVAVDVAISAAVLADVGTADATCVAAELEGAPYVARPTIGAAGTDHSLVWGSYQLDDTGTGAEDRRLFFDATIGAFRAGEVTGDQWDTANRGAQSAAFGYDNKSSGAMATTWGSTNTATANSATAGGFYNDATGSRSVALGESNAASAENAVSIGRSNTADKARSIALGSYNVAGGAGAGDAVAIGMGNQASGTNSVAIGTGTDGGVINTASGTRATVVGFENDASATDAHAYGSRSIVNAQDSMAFGREIEINDLASYGIGYTIEINEDYCVAIGDGLTVNSTARSSHVFGSNSQTSALRSMALGQDADSDIVGFLSYASGKHAVVGDRQWYLGTVSALTTDATTTELQVRGQADQIVLPNTATITGHIYVAAYVTGGAGGHANKAWGSVCHFTAKSTAAGSMAIVGETWQDNNGDGLGYACALDVTTANTIRITATGGPNSDVTWGGSLSAMVVKA